jgi:hypothetical protein
MNNFPTIARVAQSLLAVTITVASGLLFQFGHLV